MMYEERQDGYQDILELPWKYYYLNNTHIHTGDGQIPTWTIWFVSIIDATIHFRPASKWLSHLPILEQHDIIGKQIDLHFCFFGISHEGS